MDFIPIILGVVEGLTEFLPVSSTGHLILTARLLNLSQTDFLKSFEIIIQLGAILAVAVLYWRELFLKREIMKRVAAAFIPTAVLGLIFYNFIKTFLLGSSAVVIWSLLAGGIILILFEFWYNKKSFPERKNEESELKNISYGQALILGLFQSIAMVPGVSRSAAVIIGGLSLGISRKTIVEFSFLLAAPTMLAATGLDIIKSAKQFSLAQWDFLAIGFFVSFIVAMASIKFLLAYIKNHSFAVFGVYRITIALLFWLMVL